MFSDLTTRPLGASPYSDLPFAFLDQDALRNLANITAINLIENGDRTARENWQSRQLANLIGHARSRSDFWRQRLSSDVMKRGIMEDLPMQSRDDVNRQVSLEGSLTATDGNAPIAGYSSTGSTGTPVKVYVCPENGYYTVIRSLAQYFINDLSLTENRVQIAPATSLAKLDDKSLAVTTAASWAGPLGKVFSTGTAKTIIYQQDENALIDELSKSRAGYLISPNRYLDIIMKKGGVDLIKRLGVRLWIHLSDRRDAEIVKALTNIGVPSLSNYSAGEIGPIAFECQKCQDHFHVAHSNVIVECDDQLTSSFNGKVVGRLLVTHLHSYATPIIRYDVGDLGHLEEQCPCGHDGPTISNILGRGKHFLRHPDGRLLPFYMSTRMLLEAIPFNECRIRQDKVDTITLELAERESVTPDEEMKLKKLFVKMTDPAFKIEIKPVRTIDWSGNPKRLFFTSSVA
jgi:phenylacetate-coenzyme A ligase PaaK-like adenylate-forming protein